MSKEIIPVKEITRAIFVIRGQKVMSDFMFQLNAEEAERLIFQFGISKGRGGRRHRPYVFTEQGVAMLSSVLNSERAARVNVEIIRVFVRLREALETNRDLAGKFEKLAARVGGHDKQIAGIIEAIRQLIAKPESPKREIGFHVREKASRYRSPRAHRIRAAFSPLQPSNASTLSP